MTEKKGKERLKSSCQNLSWASKLKSSSDFRTRREKSPKREEENREKVGKKEGLAI